MSDMATENWHDGFRNPPKNYLYKIRYCTLGSRGMFGISGQELQESIFFVGDETNDD